MKKLTLSLAVIALTLSSCLSDLNLDPNLDIKYPGYWTAPIVNTRISLGDLVDDTLVVADPDGLVHIIYIEDSLFSQSVYEFTKVPEQEPVESEYSVGTPNVSIETHLGTFGGAKMKDITISSGKIIWTATNPVSDTIILKAKLLNTDLNGSVAEFFLTANGMGQHTGEVDITNLFFDLTQGDPAYNNIGFELAEVSVGSAPNGTKIDIKLQFEDIAIKEANGFFGNRLQTIPGSLIPTNLGIIGNIAQGLYLADPQVKLFTNSNIGLEVKLSPDITGIGSLGSVGLGLTPYTFLGSQQKGTFAQDTLFINTSNSQIDQFIANVPEQISVGGTIELNPNGEPENFITEDGTIQVGMEIDLPLSLSTKNMTVEQTLYNIDFGAEEGDFDFVEQLKLGFKVENAFPLDADLHVFFQDTSGFVIDSVTIALFDAAQVDGNGFVTAPAISTRFYEFSQDEIQDILKSDDIRIKIVLNTTGGGNQVVNLLTDYYLELKMGAQVKLNYDLSSE